MNRAAARAALFISPFVLGLALSALAAPEHALSTVRFALFIAAVVFPIGDAAAFLSMRTVESGVRLRLAPIFGIAVCFIISACALRLHQLAILWALPVLAMYGLFRRAREGVSASQVPLSFDMIHAVIGSLAVIAVQVAFVWPSRPPTESAASFLYQDAWWTIGNTESILQWGFPARDLRFAGVEFGYHFAQNVFDVVSITLGGVGSWEAVVLLDPVLIFCSLSAAVVFGAGLLLRLAPSTTAFLAAALVLSTDFALGVQQHSYPCPISYAFGLPAFVLLVSLLLAHFEERAPLPIIAFTLLLALTVASKAHLLGVVPAGIACVALVRRLRGGTLITGFELKTAAATIAVALLLKATLFSSSVAGYGLELWPVNPQGTVYRLLEDHLPSLISAPLFYAYHLGRPFIVTLVRAFDFLPIAVLLLVGLLHRESRASLRKPTFVFGAGMMVFCAMVISTIRVVGGVSYFTLYPQVTLTIVAAIVLDVFLRDPQRTQMARRIGIAITAVGIALQLVAFREHQRDWGALAPADPITRWDARAGLTLDEWNAMLWIRKTLPNNALLLCDRRVFAHEKEHTDVARFFAYSALSGHQCVAEGEEFLHPSFQAVAKNFWRAAERSWRDTLVSGTTHVIHSKRFRPVPTPLDGLSVVYENAGVTVYEIQRTVTGDEVPRLPLE